MNKCFELILIHIMIDAELIIRSSKRKKEILDILTDEGYLYQAQIGKMLKISDGAVYNYLKSLESFKLINRINSGKFVFYKISELGRNLMKNINSIK